MKFLLVFKKVASYKSGFHMKVASRKSCQFGSASGTFFTFRSSFGVLHVHTNFEVGAFAIICNQTIHPEAAVDRCKMFNEESEGSGSSDGPRYSGKMPID